MMCYRDMTFCRYYNTCVEGDNCERAMTQEVIDDADRHNMLISEFAEKPECYSESTSDAP